jgi:hypothetical protein
VASSGRISEVTFKDGNEDVLATSEPWGMRVSRRAAQEREKSRPVETATYTPEEIDAIAAEYAAEFIRTEPLDPDTTSGAKGAFHCRLWNQGLRGLSSAAEPYDLGDECLDSARSDA